MRGTLLLLAFCAAPALAENTAQPSNASRTAAVFVTAREPSLAEAAGRLDAQLSRALMGRHVEIVDLNATFPPPEPASLEDAKRSFQQGREAYDNLDPDTAVTKFNEAISTWLKHPVEVEPASLAETYVWLGASLHLRGDVEGASTAFTNALLTDPQATADPQFFAKDVLTLFTQARTAVAKHPKGKLIVDSIPAGGRVFVRGEDVGVTPLDAVDVPSGRVRVVITRPGYVPFGAFPDVPAAKDVSLKPLLEPSAGLAAMQGEVMKLTTPESFRDPKLAIAARAIGERMSARYLILSAVSTLNGKATAEVQAWDLVTGNKLTGLSVDLSSGDASATYSAAEKVQQWIEQPPTADTSSKFKVPELAKKWWFWAAVGGAAAVVATGVVVAQPHHRPDLVLGLP